MKNLQKTNSGKIAMIFCCDHISVSTYFNTFRYISIENEKLLFSLHNIIIRIHFCFYVSKFKKKKLQMKRKILFLFTIKNKMNHLF